MGLAEARSAATAARTLLDRGIDPRQGERSKQTRAVKEAASWSGRSAQRRAPGARVPQAACQAPDGKRPEYVQRFFAADVLLKWGARDARTITPREVVELLDGIVERGSPRWRTWAPAFSRKCSGLACIGDRRASPVQLLYRPGGKEKPRERALSDDELGAFLANLDAVMRFQTGGTGRTPRLAHVLRLLLLTGQRRGELALARWQDVTLTGKAPVWRIPPEHTKTGAAARGAARPRRRRRVSGAQEIRERQCLRLPARRRPGRGGPETASRLASRATRSAFRRSACQPFTAHDMRRTCRTGLARLKVPHDIAERILNHKLPAMRAVYDQHAPLEEMRAALMAWAEHLAKL